MQQRKHQASLHALSSYNCIVVLGPTASGKTVFACQLALALNGEVISADSRQVYRSLDIGTGKDLHEYIVKGREIPYHLINVAEPAQQFYLHDFIKHLHEAFQHIRNKHKWPIVCGGTGLYLDALRKDFSLTQVPENFELRAEFEKLTKHELEAQLEKFPEELVAHVDTSSKKRLVRGIEIAEYLLRHPYALVKQTLPYKPFYIGIQVDADERKQRISARLQQRLNNGLIEETEQLLASGITHQRLQQLGLEYKFVSLFLLGKLTREELFNQLQTAIFQFAKRQMTWFRKMEKEGVNIFWVKPENMKEEILAIPQRLANSPSA